MNTLEDLPLSVKHLVEINLSQLLEELPFYDNAACAAILKDALEHLQSIEPRPVRRIRHITLRIAEIEKGEK
jgi:hypothetical protein